MQYGNFPLSLPQSMFYEGATQENDMNLKSIDISEMASASSIVFDMLRKAIIEGDLTEGEPLRQEEIARIFNTSRIPVREAISRLQEQGLVKTQRYKGAVVASLSATDAAEIFDFRALIEPEIVRDAASRMTDDSILAAEKACIAFSTCTTPMDWGNLNRAFHAALYSPSALKYFIEVSHKAMDRVERYVRAQLVMSNGIGRANEEHFAILEACKAGKADAAAALTKSHILGAKDSLLRHFPRL